MSGYDYARDLMDAHTKIQQQQQRLAALEGEVDTLTQQEKAWDERVRALEGENKALREARDEWRKSSENWQRDYEAAEARLAKVEGENARLAQKVRAAGLALSEQSERFGGDSTDQYLEPHAKPIVDLVVNAAYECGKKEATLTLQARLAEVEEALRSPELLERLAAQAHKSWAGWTRWMLEKWGQLSVSGEMFQDRWRRQIGTPYEALSEQEKESDRAEAREVLAILEAVLTPAGEAPTGAREMDLTEFIHDESAGEEG